MSRRLLEPSHFRGVLGAKHKSRFSSMAGGSTTEPQVYQLRAVLRGIDLLIWRRILIRLGRATS